MPRRHRDVGLRVQCRAHPESHVLGRAVRQGSWAEFVTHTETEKNNYLTNLLLGVLFYTVPQCSESGTLGSTPVNFEGDPRNGGLCYVSTNTDTS